MAPLWSGWGCFGNFFRLVLLPRKQLYTQFSKRNGSLICSFSLQPLAVTPCHVQCVCQNRKWPWVTDPDPDATGRDDVKKLRFFWGRVYVRDIEISLQNYQKVSTQRRQTWCTGSILFGSCISFRNSSFLKISGNAGRYPVGTRSPQWMVMGAAKFKWVALYYFFCFYILSQVLLVPVSLLFLIQALVSNGLACHLSYAFMYAISVDLYALPGMIIQ